jgi:formamidopyrimidine-DNA glycosylase
MPELPEVETVCRGLSQSSAGRVITQLTLGTKGLRVPFPDNLKASLLNKRIIHITRRAKYILMTLDDDSIVLMHLGMSGSISVYSTKRPIASSHDHVIFDMDDGSEIVFNDPRRFGLIALTTSALLSDHALITSLGPEPLGNHFTASYLQQALANRNMPIKTALMSNAIVVGIGNIYAAESLFKAGILPTHPAKTIDLDGLERLIPAIRQVLLDAIASGGSSLRNYVQTDGRTGYFQHKFYVYGRAHQPCYLCSHDIMRIVQSGRSTFYCPVCQH